METVRILPVPGKLIRCPDNHKILPPQGRRVHLCKYWRRAIAAGYVTIAVELTER